VFLIKQDLQITATVMSFEAQHRNCRNRGSWVDVAIRVWDGRVTNRGQCATHSQWTTVTAPHTVSKLQSLRYTQSVKYSHCATHNQWTTVTALHTVKFSHCATHSQWTTVTALHTVSELQSLRYTQSVKTNDSRQVRDFFFPKRLVRVWDALILLFSR
jgi:hypothetical protein